MFGSWRTNHQGEPPWLGHIGYTCDTGDIVAMPVQIIRKGKASRAAAVVLDEPYIVDW